MSASVGANVAARQRPVSVRALGSEEVGERLDTLRVEGELLSRAGCTNDLDRCAQLVEVDLAGLTAGEMGTHPCRVGIGHRTLEMVRHQLERVGAADREKSPGLVQILSH